MKEVAIFDNLFGGPDRVAQLVATLIIVLGLLTRLNAQSDSN